MHGALRCGRWPQPARYLECRETFMQIGIIDRGPTPSEDDVWHSHQVQDGGIIVLEVNVCLGIIG